ncbi:MAG: 50S ribosomal protein L32e [Candidatus Woesearchaeota archaeon]
MKEELIQLRKRIKDKKPKFTRQDNHKKPKLGDKWRRPKGIDSKMRLRLKGYKKSPSKGYKSPKAVKGLSKEGLKKILVYTIKDIDPINNEEEGIIISKGVGNKKRIEIIKRANEKKINVLNIKKPLEYVKNVEDNLKDKKESKKKEKDKKEEKEKEKEKKAKEKEKKDKAESKDKGTDELADKIKEEERKRNEKKELDKKLIQTE